MNSSVNCCSCISAQFTNTAFSFSSQIAKSVVITCLFALMATLPAFAQAPGKQWDKTIGGTANDNVSSIITTADNGYLLGGTSASEISGDKSQPGRGSTDYWIVKINAQGEKLWDKTFGGSSEEVLTSLIQTADNGFLLGGYTTSGISGDKTQAGRGNIDYWVVKTDASGNKQWDKRFGGADDDKLIKLLATPDGGFLLAGLSRSEMGGDKSQNSNTFQDDEFFNWDDFWVLKISATGSKIWDKTLGSYYSDKITALFTLQDGNYLLGGYYSNSVSTTSTFFKLNSTGEQIPGGGSISSDYIAITHIVPVTGGGYLLGATSIDNFLLKRADSNFNILWEKEFGGTKNDVLHTLIAAPEGGFLLGGSSNSNAGGDKSEDNRSIVEDFSDYWLVKINTNGEKEWDKTFGGTLNENLTTTIPAHNGGYVIGGNSTSGFGADKSSAGKGEYDFWVIKTEKQGTCTASGFILREKWEKIPGAAIASIPVQTNPTSVNQLSSFETSANAGNNYGQRIRGYICAPASGNYTFYIAGDDQCELWLSTTDDPANKTRIAYVPYYTGVKQWNKYPAQQSASIALMAGKKYYIEALHKEGLYADHLAVGWTTPASAAIETIPGAVLSPAIPPVIQIVSPVNGNAFLPGSPVTLAVQVADPDGTVSKVEFFNGTARLGEDLTYPYQYEWTPATPGTYQLTVKATDVTGISGVSPLVLITVNENAATRRQWDKTLGGAKNDIRPQVIATVDGGYLLGGSSDSDISGDKSQANKGNYDYWIVKTDASGNKQWDKTFGGTENEEMYALIPTPDGGFLLGGSSSSGISGDKTTPNKGKLDYWIVKVNASGNKQWEKTFGGTGDDILYNIITTTDGGFILGGGSDSPMDGDKSQVSQGKQDYWIIKINSAGIKQWDKAFGGTEYDALTALIQTPDGGFLLGGGSSSEISGDKSASGKGVTDYWIVKTDASGNKQWDKTLGGYSHDFLSAMLPATDGGYILGGSTYSGKGADKTSIETGSWIVKINSNGVKQWDSAFGGESVSSLIRTSDGNYLLGGTTSFYTISSNYWVVKISPAGNKIWDRTYGSQDTDVLTSMALAQDGGYLLAGYSYSGIGGDKSEENRGEGSDYWVIKTFTEGAPSACAPGGTISREIWSYIEGSLISQIPLAISPTTSDELTSFETPSNIGNKYGQRIRGYICVPQTGNYTFYIAGDDNCELWLSTDEYAANKTKIASVNYFTGVRQWNKYSSQKSVSIALVAGRKYYIEALHKESVYGDNLAVGWQTPASASIEIIPGNRLYPYSAPNPARLAAGEQEKLLVEIYPNPFSDKLFLRTFQPGNVQISLIDHVGRVVYRVNKHVPNTGVNLSLPLLQAGAYLLQVQTADGKKHLTRVIRH